MFLIMVIELRFKKKIYIYRKHVLNKIGKLFFDKIRIKFFLIFSLNDLENPFS